MSTYEMERKQLFDALMKKFKIINEISDKEPVLGHDSKWDLVKRDLLLEYNRDWQKLKEKYGIE